MNMCRYEVNDEQWEKIKSHWSNLGIFKKIFEKLSSDSDFSELSIDSTYVKAHKAAAGAKKGLLMQSE